MKEIYDTTRLKMQKAYETLESNLLTLRTGRAHPAMLKKIVVDYYGSTMPIDQVASITSPDARTLLITPWDRGAMSPIEKAIRDSDLGLNPNNKGDAIFISVPMLNEERRKELIKTAKTYTEDGKIAIRNVRREAITEIGKLAKTVSEDEIKRGEVEVQKITDEFVKRIDELLEKKESDILGN
ncbi:MAG: ribosome recycling factor [Deinococcaceae bacterium]